MSTLPLPPPCWQGGEGVGTINNKSLPQQVPWSLIFPFR